MKTIEIEDELYERLMYLSNEIKTQDNRGTASPYFFQITERVEEPCWDGNCDKYIWTNYYSEWEKVDGDYNSMLEFLYENFESFYQNIQQWFKDNDLEDDVLSQLDEDQMEDLFKYLEFDKIPVCEVVKTYNAFLTEKSVKAYIESNKHHYPKGIVSDYLEYAFRNPDLETVFDFLKAL